MRMHGFYFLLITIICLQDANAKSLFDKTGLEEKHESLPEPHIQQRSIGRARDSEEEEDAESANFKLPKINTQGTVAFDIASPKRSIDDMDILPKASTSNNKYSYKRRRSNYGIVFKQGKPIGILEPISKVYDFESLSRNEDIAKRESSDDTESFAPAAEEERSGSLPTMLTNIKLRHRGEAFPLNTNLIDNNKEDLKHDTKRSTANEPVANPPENQKEKRELIESNISTIENNLKGIMNDLGLIKDASVEKREAAQEDEDMESGANKILLTKEMHAVERNKKENSVPKGMSLTSPIHSTRQLRKVTDLNEADVSLADSIDPMYRKVSKVDSTPEDESENLERRKRDQPPATKNANDIVKDLETSGDLTVSGNKSPLASSGTQTAEADTKHAVPKNEKDEKRDRISSEQEIDKRVQRNIEQKISKIKDDVKREINAIKDKQKTKSVEQKRNVNEVKKVVKEVKPTENNKKEVKQRVKRNLEEQETMDLDPAANLDSSDNVAHIRRSRDAATEQQEDSENDAVVNNNQKVNKRVAWHKVENEEIKKEAADLMKRDDNESEQSIKKIDHDPKNFEFVYRNKREGDKMEDKKELKPIEVAKRNLQNEQDLNTKRADSVIPNVQDQNARVLVTRESEAANVPLSIDLINNNQKQQNKPLETKVKREVLNNNKLDEMIAESDSLAQTLKVTRSAHSDQPIEVELRTGDKEEIRTLSRANTNAIKRDKIHEMNSKNKEDQLVEKADNIDWDDIEKREVRISKQRGESKAVDSNEEKSNRASEAVNERKDENFKVYESSGTKNLQEPVRFSEVLSIPNGDMQSANKPSDIISKEESGKLIETKKVLSEASDLSTHDDLAKNAVDKNKRASKDEGSKDETSKDETSKVSKDVKNDKTSTTVEKRSATITDKNEMVNSKDTSEESKLIEDNTSVIRQERKTEPDLTLEDMQTMDSENKSKRKRRHINDFYYVPREKRGNYMEPTNMQFRTYRSRDDEADDESDEFDDDNFDDRTSALVRKRATIQHSDNSNYDDIDEDYEPVHSETHQRGRINKRNAVKNFVSNINSDVYETPNYLYRNKRNILDNNLVGLHSGGPMLRHIAAVKERSLQPIANSRSKRLEKESVPIKQNGNAGNKEAISSLSEADIFGGLPQSYEGELSRFKRVKRDNTLEKFN